ncbi:recombinase family protein [Fluviispira vulneris]|uniref:recombinase family protein n=1 Tax=Fluviispira vulneris TaxID=2763012 RepID=UPI001648557F|nr:recombinase family protein [Fluviispira vulneris]
MSMIGYARVSSTGQSLDIQIDKLKNWHKIFKESISASSMRRENLEACLEYLREGDIFVVTKIDRLSRSTWYLWQITNESERKKVNLQILDQNINTNDSSGRLLFKLHRWIIIPRIGFLKNLYQPICYFNIFATEPHFIILYFDLNFFIIHNGFRYFLI